MATTPGTQKDTKIDGDGITTTSVNDAVTTNMAQPNADNPHEAANLSAVNEPLVDLDASESIDKAATKDGEAVPDRDTTDNQQAVTGAQVSTAAQVVVSLPHTLCRDVMAATPLPRPQTSDTFQPQPANVLHRLPPELKSRIYDLVLADGIPGSPDPIGAEEKFTRTLKLPALARVDRQTRCDVMEIFLRGKHIAVQRPRDASKIRTLEALQELAMKRYRLEFDTEGILAQMKQHAKETEDEFNKYLLRRQNLDLCPFQFVESLILTYNGRVRLNVEDGASNWDPRSFLVGFRFYSDIGFRRWKKGKSASRQLNASGDLDWTNFQNVREAFVASLIKNSFWFGCVPYVDVLLHPMIQPVVKALCMFASGQREPLRWVEVVVSDLINIPEGELGVEWANLTNDEALYGSEPDDGYRRFPGGRFPSGDEENQYGREEINLGENYEGEEEDEGEENESDDAGGFANGDGSDGRDNLNDDDKSDGDQISHTEASKILDQADENPAAVNDPKADNHPETQPEGV